jgi:hypothetical protein
MRRVQVNFGKFQCLNFSGSLAVALLLTAFLPTRSPAQQKEQKTFSSPEAASAALFAAVQGNDEQGMLAIFGPDGKQIVYSGDDVEDAENRANFAQKYQEMHRLMKEPDGTYSLYIGAMNWPAPIPIVNKGSLWYFNTDAGRKEILARRIGRNEMSAIRICQALVTAEKEYHSSQNNVYAGQIFSDEGQHNGLYWKVSEGAPSSPIGPLVAAAVAEGYDKGKNGPPTPYRGYYFHILTGQGKDAPGGAKSYLMDGKMTGGFAFLAYPAEYRASGVMTFIVGEDGVVFEKDLGKKTDTLGLKTKEFNPAPGWQKSPLEAEQTADTQKPN